VYTSAKSPSKPIKTTKNRRKVLKIAHVNICSLRSKVYEIGNLLVTDDMHILTNSETYLDNSFDDTVVAIYGSTASEEAHPNVGSVAFYVQSHIPVRLREDLMSNAVEIIWLQVHLPNLKPILVGSCFRPPSANSQYLDNMCEMFDNVSDINRGIFSG
jgi:hypothetical protein